MLQYSQDYDEQLVRSYLDVPPSVNALNINIWASLIYPYVKSTQVFYCPSDSALPRDGNRLDTDNTVTSGTKGRRISYAINSAYRQHGGGTPPALQPPSVTGEHIKISSLQAPASTVWALDTATPSTNSFVAGDFQFYWSDGNNPSVGTLNGIRYMAADNSVPLERHLETTNVLYCDGHVKAVKLSNLTKVGSGPNNSYSAYSAFTIEADPD
jgi:prepilin-type processing-associated H-X9-DG protein